MKFVSNLERRGLRIGKAEGLRDMTLKILTKRFGPVPEDVALALAATTDPAKLEKLTLGAAIEPSLDSLKTLLTGNGQETGA